MPVRKGLFSKPAWAAKSPEPFEDERPTNIFQQNVYEDLLAAKRSKENRRIAREKEKDREKGEGQNEKSESLETRSDNDRTVKKRRISNVSVHSEDDEDDDDFDKEVSGSDSDHTSLESDQNRHQRTSAIETPDKSPTRTTSGTARARSDDSKTVSPQEARVNVITVVSDDDDDNELVIYDSAPVPPSKPAPAPMKAKSKPKPPPPPESETDSDPEEDEYIKTLKRKAREEAKSKNRQALAKNANTNPSLHTTVSLDHNSVAASTTAEPQVHIYINSILPNCPPIGIIRRPSQTLESVHNYFCDTHKLGELLRSKVFFTWNNQRLYKSTTTNSILDQIKRKHGGIDKSEGKIVLEAVTDEILEYRLQQKEKARKRAEEGADNDDEADENENNGTDGAMPTTDATGVPVTSNGDENQPAPTAGVIIKLNSATPDLPSIQLRVYAHTAVDKIVRGYKKRMNLDMAKPVYLVFEGERLDGESTVADVGFEDGDCVDVRCK